MRSPVYLVVPLLVALVLVGATPSSAEGAQKREAADDEKAAVDLLDRAIRAASETAYRGVQTVQAWTGGRECGQTVRVHNVPGDGTYVAAIRNGHTVGGVAQYDRAPTRTQLGLLTEKYHVVRAGAAKLVGRWANIVDAKRSGSQAMARYWLDTHSGLMLRRDVFDDEGRLVRRSTFGELTFEATTHAMREVASKDRQRVDVGHRIPLREAADLRSEGWTVPSSVANGMSLYDVRTNGSGEDKSVHLSFSDGVSALSVFEQQGHLDESRLTGWHKADVGGRTVYVRDTVPRQLMWAGPEAVFTVVADAPDEAVADTVRALPKTEERPGFWARMARGLGRIASWCNPF